MSTIKINVLGINEVNRNLKKIHDMTPDVIGKASFAGARIVQQAIIDKAPRGTTQHKSKKGEVRAPGFLKRNIWLKGIKDKKTRYYEVGPNRSAYYGPMLEHGTAKMSARPFVRPGFDASKDKAEREMAKIVKEELNL